MAFGKFLCMVPNMHSGIVDDIAQNAIVPIKVGMVDMPYKNGEHVNHKKFLDTEPYHGKRYVLNTLVDNSFHEMKAEMCRKAHFLDTMAVSYTHLTLPTIL